MTKFFKKIHKNTKKFWAILGSFYQFGQKWISLEKKGLCQFLNIPVAYCYAKNQE